MSVGVSASFSSWKETPSELREVAISIQSQLQEHTTSMLATDSGRLSLHCVRHMIAPTLFHVPMG